MLQRIFVVSLLAVASAFAQTAQLGGRVTDASGAVVPGTTVTIRSLTTGAERRTETNEVGLYTVPLLPPGTYQIHVQHQGFKPIVQDRVQLDVDQRATADFALELGALTDQVEVSASVSRLNTVEASQGQVIDNQRIVCETIRVWGDFMVEVRWRPRTFWN